MKKKLALAFVMVAMAAFFCAGCASPEEGSQESQELEEGEEEEGALDQMPSFSAKDLDGNEVTEEIFGEKDLTVVNVWGTFCGPCIEEMPELGQWAESMPENVQLVGLIVDIDEEDQEGHDLAAEITEKAGAGFMQIIANQDFSGMLETVAGVPTTYFVNKDREIVGKVMGAYVEKYKKFVEDYLKDNGEG